MDVKTYSHARQNLAQLMDDVHDTRTPVMITRQGSKAVVILALEDYESMEETLYLQRSPANAAELRAAIKEIESGKVVRSDPTRPQAKGKKWKSSGRPARGTTTRAGKQKT